LEQSLQPEHFFAVSQSTQNSQTCEVGFVAAEITGTAGNAGDVDYGE